MTTLHDTTNVLAPEETVPVGRRREPVWRVVGGSLAAGLVGALTLTLGAFGGARESVISGSGLLAFAAGWALLAHLSDRFTSRPQRWAWVPAAAMGAGGTALIIVSPENDVLEAAGWVWPVPAFALAVWMAVQVRRGLGGRVRWLLYPVVGAIAVGSVGGMYATAATVRDHGSYPAPGTLYDVGGRRLHLLCTGSGSPTVVLQNGLGGMSVLWSRITAEVSRTSRVCAYDRAGQGWSDDVDRPQDGPQVAADLHALLQRAGESGPYVMVGHSAGGLYTAVYAAQYPDDVAGVVLLDSMSPDQFTVLADFPWQYEMMRRGLGVLPSLARLGVARVMPASAFSSLPEPAASQLRSYAVTARYFRSMRDEQSNYRTVVRDAQALTSLGDTPLVVLSASDTLGDTKGWQEAQDRLTQLSTNAQHRVVGSSHAGLLDDAESSQASVLAIADVVESVRTGHPVVAR